jgi:hypothetical protein
MGDMQTTSKGAIVLIVQFFWPTIPMLEGVKSMKSKLLFAMTVLLAGCATSEKWVSPQRSDEQSSFDWRECRDKAEDAHPRKEVIARTAQPSYDLKMNCAGVGTQTRCTTIQTPVANINDQGIANSQASREQSKLDYARAGAIAGSVATCMKVKGYTLTKN